MLSLLHVLLPVNFCGIWGFWLIWLLNPDKPLTLELGFHIGAELLTGLLALVAWFLLRKSLTGKFFHFALGLLFYASLQALGWAVEQRMWPLLLLMLLNVIVMAVHLISSTLPTTREPVETRP